MTTYLCWSNNTSSLGQTLPLAGCWVLPCENDPLRNLLCMSKVHNPLLLTPLPSGVVFTTTCAHYFPWDVLTYVHNDLRDVHTNLWGGSWTPQGSCQWRQRAGPRGRSQRKCPSLDRSKSWQFSEYFTYFSLGYYPKSILLTLPPYMPILAHNYASFRRCFFPFANVSEFYL